MDTGKNIVRLVNDFDIYSYETKDTEWSPELSALTTITPATKEDLGSIDQDSEKHYYKSSLYIIAFAKIDDQTVVYNNIVQVRPEGNTALNFTGNVVVLQTRVGLNLLRNLNGLSNYTIIPQWNEITHNNEPFNEEALQVLSAGIKAYPNITQLKFINGSFGEGASNFKPFVQALSGWTHITSLILSGNSLGEQVYELASAFPHLTNLQTIQISEGYFGLEGATILFPALHKNANLTSLNINNNAIQPEGAKLLADLLKVNQGITHLSLISNSLGSAGITSIAAVLPSGLVSLDLNFNGIEDSGANHLAGVLKNLTKLVDLNVSSNNLTDAGVKAIATSVQSLNTLKSLTVQSNSVSDETKDEISKLLSALADLNISY
jgi:hypothetical protein